MPKFCVFCGKQSEGEKPKAGQRYFCEDDDCREKYNKGILERSMRQYREWEEQKATD
jgi:hypothetical protein